MQSNTLLQLSTSLYCIELPKETYRYFFDEEYFPGQLVTFVKEGEGGIKEYPLPSGNWRILGLMPSSTELSFDAAPYLEKSERWGNTWRNYKRTDAIEYSLSSPLASLLSLLSSHHLHWTNPIEKPVESYYNKFSGHQRYRQELYKEHCKPYQSFSSTILKGQILFLTVQ